jgi:hypothetical protein
LKAALDNIYDIHIVVWSSGESIMPRASSRSASAVSSRRRKAVADAAPQNPGWTFFSNHGHVLLCLAADPQLALRDVSQSVGITERSVQRIVGELEEGGYLVRTREGRRNRYVIRRSVPLRHPIEMHKRIGDLIDLVLES